MRQLNGTWEPEIPMLTEKLQVEDPRGRAYGCGFSGADCLAVVMKRGNARGAKGQAIHATIGVVNRQREELLGCCGERQLSLNGKSRVSREAQARFREGLCQEDVKASCCAEEKVGPSKPLCRGR